MYFRLKSLLNLLYWLLYHLGFFALCNRWQRQRLILTYHNILPDSLYQPLLCNGVSHDASTFARHLRLVRKYCTVTTDFSCHAPRACLITFDDGFKNNRLAADLLQEHGIRGVFFVPVEPLISGSTLVIDEVLLWLSYVPNGRYDLPSGTTDIGNQRGQVWSSLYDWMLVNIDRWSAVPEMLDRLYRYKQLAVPTDYHEQRFQPMSLADLDLLKAAGHKIGLHSWNHRALSRLSTAELQADFAACEVLRQQVDNCNIFSYPFGNTDEVDARCLALCEQAGYSGAVINRRRWLDGNDQFQIERVQLPMDRPDHVIAARICGFDDWVRRVVGIQA